MDKVEANSLDLTKENIEKLKELFPNVVTEGKINFDVLRTILGDEVDTSKEKYQFTWNGKVESIKLAQSPSTATLRPCKEKSKNWDTTENLYIEGDNLEVLKQLQKTYFGKIKMIYIDPPYNTGNDFVYKDDFKNSVQNYKEQTNQTQKSNPETSGRYHSDWLNMMYPRLILARNLLTDDGIIFISIDDNEQANLKKMSDEIFGENSFVTILHVELSATQGMKVKAAQMGNIVKNAEYILVYSKDGRKNIASKILYDYRPDYDEHYSEFLTENDEILKVKDVYNSTHQNATINSLSDYSYNKEFQEFVSENVENIFSYDKTTGFVVADFEKDKITRINRNGKKYTLISNGEKVRQFLFLADSFGPCDDFFRSYGLRKIRGDWWKEFYKDMGNVSKEGNVVFSNGKKPIRLISQLIKMVTTKDDIVLDFFSGSATTAHAVLKESMESGIPRKFIMVQLPELCTDSNEFETICDLGEERIRRAGSQIKDNWESRKEKNGLFSDYLDSFPIDIGFKVFSLDSTNINPWDNTNEYDEASLFDTSIVFKIDRSNEDVLYEIMLKYGVFDQPVSEVNINGKTMYRVGQRHMIVCLEDKIDDNDITEICKLEPRVAVFKEDGFKDDNAKINAEYNLKKAGVEDVKCI